MRSSHRAAAAHQSARNSRFIRRARGLCASEFLKSILLAALFVGAALSANAQSMVGRRAPSFSLPDSNQKQHDILDYRGKWLLIDFMSTTCPHCKELTKTLEAFKAKHPTVAVLSIVLPPENIATVSRYIAENKVTSPILFDGSQVAVSYFPMLSPARPSLDMPHLFAVNPQGTVVKDWSQGSVGDPKFFAELEQTVAGGGTSGNSKQKSK